MEFWAGASYIFG